MYIYVDYSNEIIVFPLCTAIGGYRIIKFVFVFVTGPLRLDEPVVGSEPVTASSRSSENNGTGPSNFTCVVCESKLHPVVG